MEESDLVVIGSGVGLTVLSQGLSAGWRCALVEEGKFGGTCLTRGCIPSKVLVYPADVIREAEHARKIGITYPSPKIDWKLISERMWSQINESEEIEKGLLQAPNLTIYKGIGEFTGKYEMRVKLHTTNQWNSPFKGERFVIAAGARSFIPAIVGLEEIGYITSESFFGDKFPKVPWKSLAIIGGGIIAAEFAHIFSALGTKVTVIEMLPRLVANEEPEVSNILLREFQQHVNVLLNHKVVSVGKDNGSKFVEVEHVSTKKKQRVIVDEIFCAAGRQSNNDWLKVEKAGVKSDKHGWIETNKFLETNVKGIWAIGDVNGQYQFRHKANHDAEILVQNMFGDGNKNPVDYSAVPWAIFTYPQIAHVGLTEQEALQQGYRIFKAVKTYASIAKGFAMGLSSEEGLFKLIVDESYRILGASVIGPEASALIQQIVYLMNSGFTCPSHIRDITSILPNVANACPEAGSFMPIYRSMVIHPSVNEVVGWAIGNLHPVNIPAQDHHH